MNFHLASDSRGILYSIFSAVKLNFALEINPLSIISYLNIKVNQNKLCVFENTILIIDQLSTVPLQMFPYPRSRFIQEEGQES